LLFYLLQKSVGASDCVADGERKADVELLMEVDEVTELEKRQTVTSELRKLQFYGAGPKTALPDMLESGNDAADDDDKEYIDC